MTLPTATMSSKLKEFTIFEKLPKDIRVMIWERTFPCRTLSFSLSGYDDRAEDTPTPGPPNNPGLSVGHNDRDSLYAVSSYIVGPGGKMIGLYPPLNGLVCTTEPERIIALAVCTESRAFALGVGYQPWTLWIGTIYRSLRRIMWNPRCDIIFLDVKHAEIRGQSLFVLNDKFRNSFPKQARELRSLAIYTSHWNQKLPDQKALVGKFVGFPKLKNIVAVLDLEYEIARSRNAMNDDSVDWNMNPFLLALEQSESKQPGVLFPDSFEENLQIGKNARKQWNSWTVPAVSLTDRLGLDQGLTGGMQMSLRCYPCHDLGIYQGDGFGRRQIGELE